MVFDDKNPIKALRDLLNWSQDDLAKVVNRNQGTISSWENGKSEPRLSEIKRIIQNAKASPRQGSEDISQQILQILGLLEDNYATPIPIHGVRWSKQIPKYLSNSRKDRVKLGVDTFE